MLSLSLHWLGTRIEAGHGVEPDQFEPGLPDEEQAHTHVLHLELVDWTLEARLGLTERLAVELEMPYREVRVEAAFEGAGGERLESFESIHHRNERISGIGDVSLLGRYRWLRPKAESVGWAVDLAGGVSIPLGSTEADPFELGAQGREHQHIFFGSGTVDPIVEVSGYRKRETMPMAAWLRLRAALTENSLGYQAGERLSAGFGINPFFGLSSWSFLTQIEVYLEEPSRWGSRAARNSGRTDLLVNLGAFWLPSPSWNLHAIVRLPESLDARGGQLELAPMLLLGASTSLVLWDRR